MRAENFQSFIGIGLLLMFILYSYEYHGGKLRNKILLGLFWVTYTAVTLHLAYEVFILGRN